MTGKKLYVLLGSSSSTDAASLLSSTGIIFETVEVSDRDTLAAIYRDLSIGRLPAYQDEARVIQGIGPIRTFVEEQAK